MIHGDKKYLHISYILKPTFHFCPVSLQVFPSQSLRGLVYWLSLMAASCEVTMTRFLQEM